MRVLLLGGTAEARVLAERLHPDIDVISSLAGRVPNPALPAGEVRIDLLTRRRGLEHWPVLDVMGTGTGIAACLDVQVVLGLRQEPEVVVTLDRAAGVGYRSRKTKQL